ncbi:MAG: DNA methylase, partial [Eubacteriales bacterium]
MARLSSTYALFRVEEGGKTLFPVELPNPYLYDRSLTTILKYKGKTNEVFTKMLVNLALFTANIEPEGAKLLDPVAGRGTTLYEGFGLGMSVYGTEVYEKNVQESVQFMRKFLEKGKIKHKTSKLHVRGENRSFSAQKHMIEAKSGHFELIFGDCRYCDKLFSKQFFHVIVGDLPYGVLHGSEAGGRSRSPFQLIEESASGWHKILRKKGALVLSFNSHVITRKKLIEILEGKGFAVKKEGGYENLAHSVDASIMRDVVVAV